MAEMQFYLKSLRKIFESGVLGMGRLGYKKRQYYWVPPYKQNGINIRLWSYMI